MFPKARLGGASRRRDRPRLHYNLPNLPNVLDCINQLNATQDIEWIPHDSIHSKVILHRQLSLKRSFTNDAIRRTNSIYGYFTRTS